MSVAAVIRLGRSAARRGWRFARLGLVGGLVTVATVGWSNSSASTLPAPPESARAVVNVDLIPMTTNGSVFVMLERGGTARAVSYDRGGLAVTSVAGGRVDSAEVEDVIRRATAEDFRRACWGKSFTGSGLDRGDQFRVQIRHSADEHGECAGFLDAAPPSVGALVTAVRALAATLPKTDRSAAGGFLRAEALLADRVQQIRTKGVLPILTLAELPDAARSAVRSAVVEAPDFHPITAKDRSALHSVLLRHAEFVVLVDAEGYQLTLFH